MKKIYTLFLLVFLLVGCSNVTVNKDKLVDKLDSKFDNMLTISKQELTDKYGVDTTKFKDYVFKVEDKIPINIYILVLPKNKSEAKKEIEKFFNKKSEISNEVNKVRIKNRYQNNFGDYLFYIVSEHNKEIYSEMNEFIKIK